ADRRWALRLARRSQFTRAVATEAVQRPLSCPRTSGTLSPGARAVMQSAVSTLSRWESSEKPGGKPARIGSSHG
ncbi:MAG TPA: hypothetical protein VFD30_03080, partial [Terriglobia bacterium]|nr:hypothetical protein [Terriglobia bacterium]